MNILLGVGVFLCLVSVTIGQGGIGGYRQVDPYNNPEAKGGLKKLLAKLADIRGHPVSLPDLKAWVGVVEGNDYKYEWHTEQYHGRRYHVECTAHYWVKWWEHFSKLFEPECVDLGVGPQ